MAARTARTIVIIDDSAQITRLLQCILLQEGYRVALTNDPELGQELVRRERPDLVVMDVCMPGLDGWELCQRIRQEYDIPILILTVLAEKECQERTAQCGGSAHMTKPFPIDEFLQRVRDLLPEGAQPLGAPQPRQQGES